LKIKDTFDCQNYEIVSFDATSLFTSVNVEKTVNYIIEKIYLNPGKFFQITPEIPIPPPKILTQKFFMDVLMKYNAFETLGGFYRQKSGLSMGGKMSSALASIFVHILEEEIIQPKINNKIITSYVRYVDDVCLTIKKGHKIEILREMSKFDKGLKWTIESMKNNKLIYLDTQIVLKDSQLNLYQYRKPNASQVLTNYKYSV